VLEASPVAQAVIGLVGRGGAWQGTAGQLLDITPDPCPRDRPRTARGLCGRSPGWSPPSKRRESVSSARRPVARTSAAPLHRDAHKPRAIRWTTGAALGRVVAIR
jgi:hypothetical protein